MDAALSKRIDPGLGGQAPAPAAGTPGALCCALVQPGRAEREAFRRLARRSRHPLRIRDASGIAEARALLRDGGIDLIALDPETPDGDGLAFAVDLRRHPAHCSIPVIIVARNAGAAHVVRAMRSGAVDYLVRDGLTVNALDEAIDVAIAFRRAGPGPDVAGSAPAMGEIGDLRRTALGNVRQIKAHALPLLAFAWKAVAGGGFDPREQPAVAARLARMTRNLIGLIDDGAIAVATGQGSETPVPVDLAGLVRRIVAGEEGRIDAADVRCGDLPVLTARPSHMAMLFEELLLNAVGSARLGVIPEIEFGASTDAEGNPVIWMTENGLPLSTRGQALGARGADQAEPAAEASRDPHVWSLCQRLAERNRGQFRVADTGEASCRIMIRFSREMLV